MKIVRPVFGWMLRRGKDVAGTFVISSLFQVSRKNFVRLTHRSCPKCGEGVLFKFEEDINGRSVKALGCNLCDHYQAVDVDQDVESRVRLKAIVDEKMAQMGRKEIDRRHWRLKISSRIYYVLSSALFLLACFFVFKGAALWTFLNTVALSIYLFTQGFRAAYRCWQLRSGCLFTKGAFAEWVREGRWII